MAGVIDSDGQQWERCNGCTEFVEIERLKYEPPSDEFKYGRDLCPDCAENSPTAVQPGQLIAVHLCGGTNGECSCHTQQD